MTSSGFRPKKSGFLASLQSMLAPAIPTAADGPIVRPRAITIASVLVIIAGVVFLLIGGAYVGRGSSEANFQASQYATVIDQCNQNYGGIGTSKVPTSAPTPSNLPTTVIARTALPSVCRSVTEPALSAAALSSIKSTVTLISIVWIITGLLTAISGWFVRQGPKWARRVLIGVVLVQLILAFLFQVSNTATLLATLLIVVGLSMTFLGRAGAFFVGVALQKKQH